MERAAVGATQSSMKRMRFEGIKIGMWWVILEHYVVHCGEQTSMVVFGYRPCSRNANKGQRCRRKRTEYASVCESLQQRFT